MAETIHESELERLRRGVTEFPEYRVYFFESGATQEQYLDSANGQLFIELLPGNSFHYFRVERRGSHSFETAYESIYKYAPTESDTHASAMNGARCPSPEPLSHGRYIKRFSASLIYTDPSERPFGLAYRGWISAFGRPDMKEQNPSRPDWYIGSGTDCGTMHDNHWITAMEFRATPLNDPTA